MKARKYFAVAVPAAAAAALAMAGTANAATGPVSYTPAGADSISGYYAHALNDSVDFTHITSYAGTDGQHTIEQLPVSTVSPVAIKGAAGIALCNQQTGEAAQVGLVNAGSGLMDVVAATGHLASGNNGDLCQGGIVNPHGVNGGVTASTTYTAAIGSGSHAIPVSLSSSGTGASAAANPAGTLALTVGTPSSSTYAQAALSLKAGSVLPLLPPSFTTDKYAAGSPRWVIELANGHSLWGYPAQLGGTANTSFTGGQWAVDNGSTYLPWTAAVAGAGGTGQVVKSAFIVADGAQAPGTADTISHVQYGGQPLKVTAHHVAAGSRESFTVLKTGVPDNDTVSLDILYDAQHPFTFKGRHYSAGSIAFSATDLSAGPGVSYAGTVSAPKGTVFNEADTGAIADTQATVPLPGTPPYPNPGCNGTLNCDPSLLEGFAHVTLAGNPTSGAPVVEGSLQDNANWTAYPVASSANGKTYLGPTVFSEDHFLELVGAPVANS